MTSLSARSRKAKGRRNEKRSQAWLEARGYQVVRSAGSHGVFDLWACAPTPPILLLVQVKTGRLPAKAEIDRIRAFPVGPYTRRLIHAWHPHKRQPDCWLVRSDGELMRWHLDPPAKGWEKGLGVAQ